LLVTPAGQALPLIQLPSQQVQQAIFAAQSSGKRQQSRNGSGKDAFATIKSLLLGGGGKLASDSFNKLCADGDCGNEITGASNAIKRAYGIGPDQNLGVAWSEIEGVAERVVRGSSIVAKVPEFIFRYLNPQAKAHSESQILEYFAQKYMNNPQVQGVIRLFTYKEPCLACADVIRQFYEMFPNIQLYIYYYQPGGP
jgi:hypothetical protein